MTPEADNRRVLVIDDNPAIHDDILKILLPPKLPNNFQATRAELFGAPEPHAPQVNFTIDCADQGKQGFEMVQEAMNHGHPYAMAFVDMRMPPGWDGAETIEHIWQVDPDIQIVICTAYSDHNWEDLLTRLTHHDKLLILRKPFEAIEMRQLATSLTERWNQHIRTKHQLDHLAALQEERALEVQQVIQELEKEANPRKNTVTPHNQ
jgi:CheY-like chemotaxis protein